CRRADVRWSRRQERRGGRAPVPRHPRSAHLRGRERSPAARDREGIAEGSRRDIMTYTAHVDTFTRDNLPPRAQWPEIVFDLPELQYPERVNCVVELLDRHVAEGRGERIALRGPRGSVSYAELLDRVNRICHVLRDDLALVPGNRVLLRGPNNAAMAACWLAVVKSGLV